jgi:hypothetical protein
MFFQALCVKFQGEVWNQCAGTKKKAKMQQRMGFEGEKTGFLNSGPY